MDICERAFATPVSGAPGPSSRAACALSIILPCLNEVDSLRELVWRLARAFPPDGDISAEFIIVDDGSGDGSAQLLQQLGPSEPRLVVVSRPRRGGQSVALWDGLAVARGEYVAHLDCDLQNDPDDLPGMLQMAQQGYDAVLGYRERRHDSWSRRGASAFANAVRRAILHDHVRDVGCSTRVVRREALTALPFVPNLHRYVPALLERGGCRIVQVPVHHHPRATGKSKYGNFRRGLEGLADLSRMSRLAEQLARARKERAHVP